MNGSLLSMLQKDKTLSMKGRIMTTNEWLSVPEAAEAMKTTSINVMMHIKRGLLVGEEVDGTWRVFASSLANYLSHSKGASPGSLCKKSCGHGCSSHCS